MPTSALRPPLPSPCCSISNKALHRRDTVRHMDIPHRDRPCTIQTWPTNTSRDLPSHTVSTRKSRMIRTTHRALLNLTPRARRAHMTRITRSSRRAGASLRPRRHHQRPLDTARRPARVRLSSFPTQDRSVHTKTVPSWVEQYAGNTYFWRRMVISGFIYIRIGFIFRIHNTKLYRMLLASKMK